MNDEQERLKRLRERQLADRDPQVKQKQIQHTITHRERTERKKAYTLSMAWQTLPHVYRSPIVFLLIGLGITIVLQFVWISPWALLAGLLLTVFLVIFGAITGHALDLRDDLRDFNKH